MLRTDTHKFVLYRNSYARPLVQDGGARASRAPRLCAINQSESLSSELEDESLESLEASSWSTE